MGSYWAIQVSGNYIPLDEVSVPPHTPTGSTGSAVQDPPFDASVNPLLQEQLNEPSLFSQTCSQMLDPSMHAFTTMKKMIHVYMHS